MGDKKGEDVPLQPMNRPASPPPSGGGGGDDYDPHDHREVENPTNNFETLVHLLKSSLGTGILAMPQAFQYAGLITGIIATLVIGVIITHCLHTLVRSQYQLCKRRRVPLLTYPESMVVAFEIGPTMLKRCANCSRVVVDVFLVVYQLGICCVYIVFIATNQKKLVDPYYPLSLEVHMLITLGPLILANCIRNLKMLAPFSSLANFLILIGLGLIVYFLLTTQKKSQASLDYWGSIYTFPLFFGTVLFALTAVGVVIALENNMATPKAFGTPCGVLNIGMGFIVLLYIALGIIGYLFCIDKCDDSITLDLPSGTTLTVSVLVMYMIAILLSYVLQCYVPVEILWKCYVKPRLVNRGVTKFLPWEYGLRIALCLLTFVVAMSVPRLGLFISLFGAFCLSALGLIFPAMMEIFVLMPNNFGTAKWKLIKDVLIIIFGVFGGVVGTVTTIKAMCKSFGVTC